MTALYQNWMVSISYNKEQLEFDRSGSRFVESVIHDVELVTASLADPVTMPRLS